MVFGFLRGRVRCYNASPSPKCELHVVDNNRVIYHKGFGFADKENNVAVTGPSLFHIGSITKLFISLFITTGCVLRNYYFSGIFQDPEA
jgi:CubicO group peptidase (beta-lactamase class C family)